MATTDATKRERLAEIIREASATFIERETNNASLITVTRVELTDNLKKAVIFVTVMPESKTDEAVAFLRRLRSDIRHDLVKHHRLPRAPMIDIMNDAGEKHRMHIEQLLKDIETK
jgi:ribosome-binding factor A